MALFLLCFIVFVIWFRVKMNKNNSQGSTADELFWEREEKANHARKKDISSLDYLTPDLSRLPLVETSDDKEAELAAMVKKYASEKMINLSQYSNTDLKEAYGPANLETLSNCDQSFLLFIRSLSDWGNYLFGKKHIPAPDRSTNTPLKLKVIFLPSTSTSVLFMPKAKNMKSSTT